jgi:hypothetical protein
VSIFLKLTTASHSYDGRAIVPFDMLGSDANWGVFRFFSYKRILIYFYARRLDALDVHVFAVRKAVQLCVRKNMRDKVMRSSAQHLRIEFLHAATLFQVTLHEVCRCLRVNDIAWLPSSPNGRIDQQQQLLRQRWGWSVFGWMLRHLAFPLVRSHFFVTETKESGSRMYAAARRPLCLGNTFIRLFVRKPVWAALRCTFMSQSRLQSLYTPVSKAERRGDSRQSAESCAPSRLSPQEI